MKIERKDVGPVTILRIAGDIDSKAVDKLRSVIYECMADGKVQLVVNLSGVRFITYMAVGVFVERLRKLRSLNGDLRLVGLNLYLSRLLRMVGVAALFDKYESEEEVFEELKMAVGFSGYSSRANSCKVHSPQKRIKRDSKNSQRSLVSKARMNAENRYSDQEIEANWTAYEIDCGLLPVQQAGWFAAYNSGSRIALAPSKEEALAHVKTLKPIGPVLFLKVSSNESEATVTFASPRALQS
ncbi:MAG: STAS domain-containing protein [Candidatus Hydrogenedentes bacterium]|nr:STAS domain-containing protein [Candidatus Hydrogenedentota bacterium]